MSDSWRLFVALELPRELLRRIARVQDSLKLSIPDRAVKWVRPEGIHLTLKFLGDVPISQLDDIAAALERAVRGHSAFALEIEGLGCFPNIRAPRVLWMGMLGDVRQLAALQSSLEAEIAPLGYPSEERGFHPHLTLARAAREASRADLAAVGAAAEKGIGNLGGWRVESVSLIRSQLRSDGAVYTRVGEVKLER